MPWHRHRSAAGRRSAGAGCRRRRRRPLGVHRWPGRWPRGSRGGCRRSCHWRILGLRGRAEVARSLALSVQLGGWCEPHVVDGVVRSEKVWSGRGGRSRIVCIMPAERVMPTEESQDLIDLTRKICADQLAPKVSAAEEASTFPRETFALLGSAGLLSLPYAEELGGTHLGRELVGADLARQVDEVL